MCVKNLLSVCIPTYNRPNIVKDTLRYELASMKELKVDMYIYDSSSNNETEKIIVEFQNKGFNNLYYIKLPSDISLENKVTKIYQKYEIEKDYEYIWLTNDVFGISKILLKDVLSYLGHEYSMILVNNRDMERIGIKEYNNQGNFFDDCAWRSTLFGAVITNKKLLEKVDWDKILAKYTGIEFFYVAMYFETILQLDKFRALHIGTGNGIRYSKLKKDSHWKEKTFQVWCTYWQEAINMLPQYYKNKAIVIKKLGIYSGLFTKVGLVSAKINGLYNYRIYKEFKYRLLATTNLSNVSLFIISITPISILKLGLLWR